jgi:steroid delta-isomerase-like uncharacterized protein
METPSRRVFEEVWNRKNRAVIDELMAANYVHHDPQASDIPDGIEGYKKFVDQYLSAFPDLQMTIHEDMVAGDTTVTRWTAKGTHTGDLPGLPRTGKSVSVTGITVARVKNGKFVESWNNWDALGMMQQLGVIPNESTNRAA